MDFSRTELGIIRIAIARELIRLSKRTNALRKKKSHKAGELSSHAMEYAEVQALWDKIK